MRLPIQKIIIIIIINLYLLVITIIVTHLASNPKRVEPDFRASSNALRKREEIML